MSDLVSLLQIIRVILGKHKPIYDPALLLGDYVVVVNAEQMVLSGRKMEQGKRTYVLFLTSAKCDLKIAGISSSISVTVADFSQHGPFSTFAIRMTVAEFPHHRIGLNV